jgi:cytochrome c oxidase cbb3-type subunit I/II
MKTLGAPYLDQEIKNAEVNAKAQAREIAEGLEAQGVPKGMEDKEIIALIAYLQRLGKDMGGKK